MSRTPSLQRLLGDTRFSVVHVPADGDCFYRCICQALSLQPSPQRLNPSRQSKKVMATRPAGLPYPTTVAKLRGLVASMVDQHVLEGFRGAAAAGLEGYSFVWKCNSVEKLAMRIRMTAEDSVGEGVIWADDFALHCIARALPVALLIIDMAAKPANRFLTIPTRLSPSTHCVIIRRSTAHYDLVTLCGKGTATVSELPDAVRCLFGLEEGGRKLVPEPLVPPSPSPSPSSSPAPSCESGSECDSSESSFASAASESSVASAPTPARSRARARPRPRARPRAARAPSTTKKRKLEKKKEEDDDDEGEGEGEGEGGQGGDDGISARTRSKSARPAASRKRTARASPWTARKRRARPRAR